MLAAFSQVFVEKTQDRVELVGIIDGTKISSNVVHVNDKIHVFFNVIFYIIMLGS